MGVGEPEETVRGHSQTPGARTFPTAAGFGLGVARSASEPGSCGAALAGPLGAQGKRVIRRGKGRAHRRTWGQRRHQPAQVTSQPEEPESFLLCSASPCFRRALGVLKSYDLEGLSLGTPRRMGELVGRHWLRHKAVG